MRKILKNLKKSWISVIIILLLLIIQANIDLELPNYTSKIVNVGIQQSGIERIIPEVICEEKMNELLLFSSEKDEILQYYELAAEIENRDNKYLKIYPEINKNNLYVLKDINNTEKNKLEEMIKDTIVLYSVLNNEQYSEIIKNNILENMPEGKKAAIFDLSMIDIIRNLPKNELEQTISEFRNKIEEYGSSITDQLAIATIKSEYEEIGIDIAKYQNRYLIKTGARMLGVAFISMFCAIIIMLLSTKVSAKLGKDLREKVFEKVLSFSNAEFNKFSTASLITRSTNDVQHIQNLMERLFKVIVYAPIMGIGGFLHVLQNKRASMAWIIGLAIILILGIIIVLFIVAMPIFKKLQTLIDRINGVSREMLTGIPVIRAFSREQYEEKRFEIENENLMKANVFVNKTMSIMMPALMVIMNGISILIIWVGGHRVDDGLMQVGDIMAFIQYTIQIVTSFLFISLLSIMLPRASVSAKRINEILETENLIKESENPIPLDKNKKGLVEFKNVSFKYPDADRNILEGIDFVAEPGKTTAIIGSTGSGKSTVVNLIPRFYDASDGEVMIDGVNVKDVKFKDLREVIGFVPQKGMLFSGTIESNIKYADENMSDENMKNAAEIAQAVEFIEAKQEKYNSEIAQGGNNVSGGQKQRLSIARAIAKQPEIFVFDDSFSALDFKTDSNLRAELKEKTKGKTVIIVAQRINTILDAEQIIVLNEGKMVGKGTHQELMKNNEIYKKIALSQLSEEEANRG